MRLLSPVPTELDSSEFLEGSIADDVSFQASIATGPIASLRDAVDNRITLVRNALTVAFRCGTKVYFTFRWGVSSVS